MQTWYNYVSNCEKLMEKAGDWKHLGYTIQVMYRSYLPFLVNKIIGKAIG